MAQQNSPRDSRTSTGTTGSSTSGGSQASGTQKSGTTSGKDLPSTSTATSATAGNENFQDQISALRSDLSQLTNTVTQLLGQGSSLREAAGGAIKAAAGAVGLTRDQMEQGRQLAGQAQTQMAAMAREIESQIERNPMTAVLVALGVGFTVGLMSRGR